MEEEEMKAALAEVKRIGREFSVMRIIRWESLLNARLEARAEA